VAQPAPDRAGAPDDGSAYDVRWPLDLTIIAVATATWAGPLPFMHDLVSPSCPCQRVDIPAIDRFALDRRSEAARVASDVAVTTVVALPVVLDAVDVRRQGGTWTGVAKDGLVMAEAVLVSGALNQIVKLAAHRPRPLLYSVPPGSAELSEPDNYLSFYSGHSSTAFAAGMAYATTFALHHPDSPYRYAVYGAAGTVAGGVGLLRVLAGKHFPTDVLTGALVGSVVGVGVPMLHRRQRAALSIHPTGEGIMLTGRF
jgi:membrane-associated phospholipid phosphatase